MPKLATLSRDADVTEVRSALVDGARTLMELRSTPADKRGDTFTADVREVADFIHDLNLVESALSVEERTKRQADDDARNKGRGSRAFGVGDDMGEYRTMGRQVVDDEGYAEWAKRGRPGGAYQAEVRNLIGGFTAGAYDYGADNILPVGSPAFAIGSQERRRPFLRSLMSVQSTGLRVVPYWREKNQVTNETGAAMTSEGSAKAEVTAEFESYSAIIEKISAWIPATDEILTDAPTLRGYIDTRLTYMLDIREEAQLLTGSGTSPNILGLDNVSGVQTQSVVAGDYPACVGQAIGKVENKDGEANGVATNPLDYWVGVTTRHANQFDNGFGGGAPSGRVADGNITWGLPAVRSRAVASGYAYVADWRMGVTVFDRQETTIKVGDQHSDYFIRNLLVILAETRVGAAWHRGSLFVKAAVPTS